MPIQQECKVKSQQLSDCTDNIYIYNLQLIDRKFGQGSGMSCLLFNIRPGVTLQKSDKFQHIMKQTWEGFGGGQKLVQNIASNTKRLGSKSREKFK